MPKAAAILPSGKTRPRLLKFLFPIAVSALVCSGIALACKSTQPSTASDLADDLLSRPKKVEGKTVAIFAPEIRGDANSTEAAELADALTNELVTRSNLRVIERSRLQEIYKERELVQAGVTDQATAAKFGRLMSVDAVLIGSITGKPDTIAVSLRLVDSASAEIIATSSRKIPRSARVTGTLPKAPKRETQAKQATGVASTTPADFSSSGQVNISEGEPAKGELTDISFSLHRPGGYSQIIGRVHNLGPQPLNDPRVSAQLYNNANGLIGGAACSGPGRPVMRNQKLPFHCLFKPTPDYHHYQLSYEPELRQYETHALNISAKGLVFRHNTNSLLKNYSLAGVLKNNEARSVQYAKALASFFDKSGKFIGQASAFSVRKKLKPGEESPFVMTVYPYSLHGKPARYEVHYSALYLHE